MRLPVSHVTARSRAGRRARIERLAWRQRVEVAREDVHVVAVRPGHREQAAHLLHASPFGPVRVHRAQVHAEDDQAGLWHQRQNRMLSPYGPPPSVRGPPPYGSGTQARILGAPSHWAMPAPSATRATTAGEVTSSGTTRSAPDSRMTEASASLPGPRLRDGCCRSPLKRPSAVGFPNEGQIRLAEQVAAEKHHDVTGDLNVYRATHHRDQARPKRHQRGRDVRVVVAERLAVDAWHEEAVAASTVPAGPARPA